MTTLTCDEIKEKIANDPEFVNVKKVGYEVAQLLECCGGECPDRVIAKALMISEKEVEDIYQSVVEKLRSLMSVSL